MDDLLEHNSDLSAKLMQIGDSIVYKLVQWTKRLPFYLELPVEVSHSDSRTNDFLRSKIDINRYLFNIMCL